MRRTLSIGAKWTLRYVAVMLITTSIFAYFVYERAEERIRKDAGLLAELQLAQLIAYVDSHPGAIEEWRAFADRQAQGADPELRVGIQLFEPDGRPVAAVGAAGLTTIPLPSQVVLGKMNKEIAATLGIHERTVKLHRTAISTKIGVHSVAQLVLLTQESGLLESESAIFP